MRSWIVGIALFVTSLSACAVTEEGALEVSEAAFTAGACDAQRTCAECTDKFWCGWCDGRCVAANRDGPTAGAACAGYAFVPNACSAAAPAGADPPPHVTEPTTGHAYSCELIAPSPYGGHERSAGCVRAQSATEAENQFLSWTRSPECYRAGCVAADRCRVVDQCRDRFIPRQPDLIHGGAAVEMACGTSSDCPGTTTCYRFGWSGDLVPLRICRASQPEPCRSDSECAPELKCRWFDRGATRVCVGGSVGASAPYVPPGSGIK